MENYLSGFALLFIAYNLFVGLLNTVALNAMTANQWSLSPIEDRLFKQNRFLSIGTPILTLILRINGAAFLVYLGFQIVWYSPIVLYLIAVLILGAVSVILRATIGLLMPALLGYLFGPILGILLWFSL